VSSQKAVVLVPSLGRPASDFAHLEKDLAGAGFLPVSVEPFAEWEGEPTLHDLAGAFNSRVESLTLLAAGGLVEPEPHIWRALSQCYNTELSPEEHLSYVKEAFFADGNDPTVWRDGWMPTVMRYQRAAVQRTPRDEWWSANVDRVLVVQGLQDAIAPVENGRRYKSESAPHAQLVEVNNAGHALLPEQPQAIAEAVLRFLSQ